MSAASVSSRRPIPANATRVTGGVGGHVHIARVDPMLRRPNLARFFSRSKRMFCSALSRRNFAGAATILHTCPTKMRFWRVSARDSVGCTKQIVSFRRSCASCWRRWRRLNVMRLRPPQSPILKPDRCLILTGRECRASSPGELLSSLKQRGVVDLEAGKQGTKRGLCKAPGHGC